MTALRCNCADCGPVGLLWAPARPVVRPTSTIALTQNCFFVSIGYASGANERSRSGGPLAALVAGLCHRRGASIGRCRDLAQADEMLPAPACCSPRSGGKVHDSRAPERAA